VKEMKKSIGIRMLLAGRSGVWILVGGKIFRTHGIDYPPHLVLRLKF